MVDHAAADHLVLSQGNGQTAVANNSVSTNPEVTVEDAFGNTVDAFTVNFAILTGAGSVGAATDSSDASGLAAVSWTLGTAVGANTMKAENLALPGTPKTINFSATGTADAADHLALSQGNAQTAVANNAVSTAPEVIVEDQHGNPVAGFTVNFSVLTGGGSVGAATDSSDASGLGSVSWTLGTAAGANTMKAENLALPGTPKTINFTGTAEADAAAQLAFTTQPSGANTAGTNFGTQPVVEVQDTHGNLILASDPLASNTVTLEMHDNVGCTSAHGGTFNSNTVAASSGTATFAGADYETAATGLYLKASLGALTARMFFCLSC